MSRQSDIFVTVDVVIFALVTMICRDCWFDERIRHLRANGPSRAALCGMRNRLRMPRLRELFEETGVRDVHIEQLYTFGTIDRDPRGRMVTVAYVALVPAPLALHAGTDASEAQWKSMYALPEMAFDHEEIVTYALRRLRYKLEYTAVGFRMLPKTFTLSQLQRAYETILGERLDKRNFRRRILQAGVIEETGEMQTGDGRPAKLYRYREDAVAEVRARRLFP